MRRLERIAAHVHGNGEKPLWVDLMDSGIDRVERPRGGACRCTADKWRFVCRCFPCLEHVGRAHDFDWSPELVPPTSCSGATGQLRQPYVLAPLATASGDSGKRLPAQPPGEELRAERTAAGLTRLASLDGRVLGMVSPSAHPRFTGIATFARLPQLEELRAWRLAKGWQALEGREEEVDIAIMGVPFDSGCSFRPGARFGPEAIRANSRLIRPYMIATGQRPLLEQQVVDVGDVDATPFGIDRAQEQILQACREKLKLARRLVLLGGDHTLSYPAIKAAAEKFGPVVLIHFDSHLDTFPPIFDQDVWHGSPFRKCWEEDLLAKDGSTHIGIRATTYSEHDFRESEAMGMATLTAEDVFERGVKECVQVVRDRHKLAGGNAPVYLSIDIDVLDPSVAPGTGTPEFGGLLAMQLLQFVRGLKGLPIVGADVVEVAPAYDHAGITAMAAASIILEEIALMSSSMEEIL